MSKLHLLIVVSDLKFWLAKDYSVVSVVKYSKRLKSIARLLGLDT